MRYLLLLFLAIPMMAQDKHVKRPKPNPDCTNYRKLQLDRGAKPTEIDACGNSIARKMVCWDGFEATEETKDKCKGDWIEDQTGKSMPAGDGCNTVTCMNAACNYSSSTAMGCAYHPKSQEIWPSLHVRDDTKPESNSPVVPKKKDDTFKGTADICGNDGKNCLFTTSDIGTITLPMRDGHGCDWSFQWDEVSQTCTIHISFTVHDGIVTCSPVSVDQAGEKMQHLVCWYKPIEDKK